MRVSPCQISHLSFAGNAHRFRSYYLSGYLTLQTTLDRFMFKRALPASSADASEDAPGERFACTPPDVIGVPFPTAAYDQNLFYAAVGYLLGLAMTMVSSDSFDGFDNVALRM